MGGATWKGKASGFDPTKGLTWTAQTEVRVIRDLVRDREDVAARHRRLKDPSLIHRSKVKVSALFETIELRNASQRYSEFCEALKMPTYPLTTATIALFLFAKCSYENKHYHSNLNYLKQMREASKSLWRDQDGFDVENTEELEKGLREFQAERRFTAIAPRPSLPKTVGGEKLIESDGSNRILPEGAFRRARGGPKRGYESVADDSGGDSPNDGEDIDKVEVEQLSTPGLPQPGDRFKSKAEFLAATYAALLPIYGIGARHVSTTRYIECSRAHTSYRGSQEGECGWRIGMKKDQVTGEVIVAKEGSNFYHNHGPAPRLIKDPSWRPTIKNKLVRQRLGMGELIPKKRRSIPRPASSASESFDSDSEAESNSQSQISFKKPNLPRRYSAPFAMPSPSHASTSAPTPIPSVRNDTPLLHSLPRHYPSQLQYPSSSVYTQPQSIPHQYQSQFEYPSDFPSQNHTRPVITTLSPSSSDAFLPRLASFLRSLHPSLDSLALPLYTSGIQSKELLDLFCAFEFTTLDLYFTLLKERNPDQEISNVHVRLLKKKLKEAQDGDWASYRGYCFLPRRKIRLHSLGSSYPGLNRHINDTLKSLGLQDIANNKIGTPLSRGISGGQKRRVTIACSVVTKPQILILDEPTSGLDASSSREVVTFLRYLAHELNMCVVCTIHQPNWETFSLFDNLLLLAGGRTMYSGPVSELDSYLSWTGSPTPKFANPADHAIQLVNTEFMKPDSQHRSALDHLTHYSELWSRYGIEKPLVTHDTPENTFSKTRRGGTKNLINNFRKLNVLMYRNLLNYSRNVLAYGIRLAMYCGMGLLLATIWIHLGYSAEKINDRLSVSFFAVAFLGFMSVAGIPSFLEERSVFIRERRNGLYGSGVYVLAQSIVSIPFLFLCSLAFSLIIYWSIGMNPGASHFFKFLIYLFLALYTAESQSLLVAAIFPLFVAALAIASFANGLWMCNMGYFIRTASLPRFWFYVVHWIDYQTYSFNLLVKNDFAGQILDCPIIDGICSCPIPSSLSPSQCALSGEDVVRNLNISGSEGMSVGLLILICVVFRFLFYVGIAWRK